MVSQISPKQFPNSSSDPFLITSRKDNAYNCIAWAYGDISKWFWPDNDYRSFWPKDIPHECTLDAFIRLFGKIGYEVCYDGEMEIGFEKIAIYTDSDNLPTHASRQLESGLWTSKLGIEYDVEHSLASMEDGVYGNVTVFMKRYEK